MRSDIGAYVRGVVAVLEPEPNLTAIRQRAMRFRSPARGGGSAETVMPALVAIVMLAFVLAGQIASPAHSTSSIRTPAPAPAQT
jgi:hypothetical protein